MQVIACAKNGKEAVEMAARLKPNLITMDIHMPVMDGFDAIRLIMAQCPTPIVVISSRLQDNEIRATCEALDAGALSVLEKPMNVNSPAFSKIKKHMVDTIRNMAEIKVITRRFYKSLPQKSLAFSAPLKEIKNRNYEIIAIGTSVGGPQALKAILTKLPANFPVPVVVVQHMTPGFIEGFTHWLNENTELKIKNAENSELLSNGTVYFAPDNFHLTVKRNQGKLHACLVKEEAVSGFCPSATKLLQSVANVCGKNSIGVLLTGMGSDGAQGLLELKKAHGHTFVQDEKSAVVWGMAGVADSLGAVDRIVELDQMARYLIDLVMPAK